MQSKNKTVNKAIDVFVTKRAKLLDRRQKLRERIDEKYPFEIYGIRGEEIFDEKKQELDDEITLMTSYICGMNDLVEIMEGQHE